MISLAQHRKEDIISYITNHFLTFVEYTELKAEYRWKSSLTLGKRKLQIEWNFLKILTY